MFAALGRRSVRGALEASNDLVGPREAMLWSPAMSSPAHQEWHVRWQRPDARTRLLSFIDANADRITFRQFFQLMGSNEAFRKVFIGALADSELKSFVWEMPAIGKRSLVYEFECALTEVPPPKKVRVRPAKFADHFSDEESVVAFARAEGEGAIVVPCPRQAEGWYADVATFIRRVHPTQVDALWQKVAETAKGMLGAEKIRACSSTPGAPWLHFEIGPLPKAAAYSKY